MARDQASTTVSCRETIDWRSGVDAKEREGGLCDMSNGKVPYEVQIGAVQPVVLDSTLIDSNLAVSCSNEQPSESVSPKRLSIGPVPHRLRMYIPPTNFGAVEKGSIYRSGYPKPENFDFLAGLKLKTILTLVPEPLSTEYLEFIHANGIRHVQIHIPANKDGNINITPERMCMALSVVLERKNHPILIHCNRGKHRTGCVTACFRKIQSLSGDAAITEYRDYSYPKCRDDDMAFIESFDPLALYPYAQSKGWTVTPPPEPSDDQWFTREDSLVFSLADIAALKLPEEPDSSL